MHLFHPPGFVDDLGTTGRAHWHAHMAATTAFQRALLVGELRRTHAHATEAHLAYVDPRKTDVPAGIAPAGQPWNGFPRAVLEHYAQGDHEAAWEIAERRQAKAAHTTRDGRPVTLEFRAFQDEYLEWHGEADEHGIHRVSFTCEGPEYWEQLSQVKFERVHELYCEHLRRDIPPDDLRFAEDVLERGRRRYRAGQYNPHNRWNTSDGAMHLTHPSNTLGAEINLAARATVARRDIRDDLVESKLELICCAGFGDPNRDSDPSIGATANAVVRQGKLLTLTNPIGLYIASFDGEAITLRDGADVPGGSTPDTWWRCTRGDERGDDGGVRMVRVEYEIPAGATMPDDQGGRRPLRLADLDVNGLAATRAAALAELVGMHLYVTAWEAGGERLELHCDTTCCLRDGLLDLCRDPANAQFPDLYSPGRQSPQLDDDEVGAIFDATYQSTYDEALAEAEVVLRTQLEAVGAFALDTGEAEPEPGGLAAFVTASRA
jgi:hypothetical protein